MGGITGRGYNRELPPGHAYCPECDGWGNHCDPGCGSNCSPNCPTDPGVDPRCDRCGGDGTVPEASLTADELSGSTRHA